MNNLNKTDWKILKLLDDNKELSLKDICKKLNNSGSEEEIRTKIMNLIYLNLLSYTAESIKDKYTKNSFIESFEITLKGHKLVTKHFSVKKGNWWNNLF